MTRNVIYDTHQISESILVLYPGCTTSCIIFLCHHFLFSHVHSMIFYIFVILEIHKLSLLQQIHKSCMPIYKLLGHLLWININPLVIHKCPQMKKMAIKKLQKILLIKNPTNKTKDQQKFFYMQAVFATKSLENNKSDVSKCLLYIVPRPGHH